MKRLTPYSTLSLTVVSLSLLIALFFLFDSYVNRVAIETMANWKRAEEISIMEGNLLSSVTKNQKIMLSSDFLKGVLLIDYDKPQQLEQIMFGDRIDISAIRSESIGTNNIEVIRVGLFKRYVLANIPNQPSMMIAFSIWSQNYETVFFLSCLLFLSLFGFYAFVVNKIKKDEYKLREKQTRDYAQKAARASHDIRSPLAILSATIENEDLRPDVSEKLASVTNQLREITRDLIDGRFAVVGTKHKTPEANTSPVDRRLMSVSKELENLLKNKNEVLGSSKIAIEYDVDEIQIQLSIATSELKRAISNVLDNAVEACGANGLVKLRCKAYEDEVIIEVRDNGKGIPKDILEYIGERGFSHGKKNGSGIGVYYTKLAVNEAGGSFSIDSTEGIGTKVTLVIPYQKTRVITPTNIQIEKGHNVVVLDDDPEIHRFWQNYFEKSDLKQKLNITYFYKPNDVLNAKIDMSKSFLLSDYDLQDTMDGLDVINRIEANSKALLVTGMAHSNIVRDKAQRLGCIPILSKDDLGKVFINIIV
jgi:signal transduction histidine kinase